MPRSRSCRSVGLAPPSLVFRPASIKRTMPAPEVVLGLDGLEAMRLTYLVGLEQEEAATRMEVSRATFGRILRHACATVTGALVEGRPLRFDDRTTCPGPCTCETDGGGARARRANAE